MIRMLSRVVTFAISTVALAFAGPALAQTKIRMGIATIAPLAPMFTLPEVAAKSGLIIEFVQFQRFADARTALASGDLDVTFYGPQDLSLALAQGNRSMVAVAGVAGGGDCLIVRKGEDIRDWKQLEGKSIGVGAGSISWLKFAASTQEGGVPYNKMKIVNMVGGGAVYTRALQDKQIDMAVVWQPFCAQGILDGFAQYPTVDHNKSKMVGPMVAVLAMSKPFLDKNRDAAQKLVDAYYAVMQSFRNDRTRWAAVFAEKSGLPPNVAAEAISRTILDETLPLQSIKRVTKYLAENGIVQRDVSGELDQYFNYELLAKATGKTPKQLGIDQ
ncbi:MAG: ABC transporter substrate-binding protein [Burkholderiales bacterium]